MASKFDCCDWNLCRDEFGEVALRKFPRWDKSARLISVYRQLADVSRCIHVSQDLLPRNNKKYDQLPHRIAAALADLLILAHECKADLNAELPKVFKYFDRKPDITESRGHARRGGVN